MAQTRTKLITFSIQDQEDTVLLIFISVVTSKNIHMLYYRLIKNNDITYSLFGRTCNELEFNWHISSNG